MKPDNSMFDPMIYDALLELATRLGGRYLAWRDQASNEAVARYWDAAHDEMQRRVHAVDPNSRAQIEAMRASLRDEWEGFPSPPEVHGLQAGSMNI